MSDRYIPTPHDAQYLPASRQGEAEAAGRGCPYPWNTPAWHVWNEGYQKAVSRIAQKLIDTKGQQS